MIDVALTGLGPGPADVAVVIDVLRATTTVTEALAAGYERVRCVAGIEQAELLRAPGRVLAGERGCLMPPGFDQGNSPVEARVQRGRELVLATTNGAPAIVNAAHQASEVIVACLLNLGAVIEAVAGLGDLDELQLLVVCAGTDGAPAVEDTFVAGALCAALQGARTDTARIAESVSRAYPTPSAALNAGAGASALRRAGLAGDIAHCERVSQIALVPRVSAADGDSAVVDRLGRCGVPAPAVGRLVPSWP